MSQHVCISAAELREMSIWEILERLDPQQWDWRAARAAALAAPHSSIEEALQAAVETRGR